MKRVTVIFTLISALNAFDALGSEECINGLILNDSESKEYFKVLQRLSPAIAVVAADTAETYKLKHSKPINTCDLSKTLTSNMNAQKAYHLVDQKFAKKDCTEFDKQCLGERLTEYKSLINAIDFD